MATQVAKRIRIRKRTRTTRACTRSNARNQSTNYPPNANADSSPPPFSGAERPLVIVGKGMAYAQAEAAVRRLVGDFNLPFLPTPMGKGVVSDYHPNLVIAARSKALLEADVVVLLGARLNWILHFGLPPRSVRACVCVRRCIPSVGGSVG